MKRTNQTTKLVAYTRGLRSKNKRLKSIVLETFIFSQ